MHDMCSDCTDNSQCHIYVIDMHDIMVSDDHVVVDMIKKNVLFLPVVRA